MLVFVLNDHSCVTSDDTQNTILKHHSLSLCPFTTRLWPTTIDLFFNAILFLRAVLLCFLFHCLAPCWLLKLILFAYLSVKRGSATLLCSGHSNYSSIHFHL
ncbi:hypothetical protein BC833DRAFT_574574 [Globomyces pollinis-pini]|nr:hypothetical protein BC833DRAFT_574574 [Globomyces pollinis-pini]